MNPAAPTKVGRAFVPPRSAFPVVLLLLIWGCASSHARANSAGAVTPPPDGAAARRAAREAIARFEKNWKQPRGLMPFGDPSWKARLEALVAVARAGLGAAPALVEAMDSPSPATRALAAQALGLMAAPAARERLRRALADDDMCVRMHAAVALARLGGVAPDAACLAIMEKEPNWLVRAQTAYAFARDERPDPSAVRDALADYDPASADTAAVGRPAPDFSLEGAFGNTYRLSDFRGRKPVVLVFLALDL